MSTSLPRRRRDPIHRYDNNFIYFQPGNGKLKTKEPKDQIKIAQSKLKTIIGSL